MHRTEPIAYHIRSRSCEPCWKRSQTRASAPTPGLKFMPAPRRLSLDLKPAPAEDHHRQLPTDLGPRRLSSLSTTRATNKEKHYVLRHHHHLRRPHDLHPHLHRPARPHQRQLAPAVIRTPIQQKRPLSSGLSHLNPCLPANHQQPLVLHLALPDRDLRVGPLHHAGELIPPLHQHQRIGSIGHLPKPNPFQLLLSLQPI